MSNWLEEAKIKGSMTATEDLLELDVDQSQPIDIFSIIEASGIWLLFGALDTALGTFVRQDNVAGILVNNRRPRSVQRLTAAHEYGHFRLGHQTSVDGSTEINGFSKVRQEVEAQAYALDFLMPLALVESSWDDLSLPQPSEVQAHQAYQLATSMGVSYQACVVQLRAMEKITHDRARNLLSYEPKRIKQLLAGGVGPIDPWADMWPLEEKDHGKALHVRRRDELRIKLPEEPSSGYVWQLAQSDDETSFFIAGDEYEQLRGFEEELGTGGHRFLSLRAERTGTWNLSILLQRPWNSKTLKEFKVHVEVLENEFGGEPTGPREWVRQNLAAGV